jgi:hypothetical protein
MHCLLKTETEEGKKVVKKTFEAILCGKAKSQ